MPTAQPTSSETAAIVVLHLNGFANSRLARVGTQGGSRDSETLADVSSRVTDCMLLITANGGMAVQAVMMLNLPQETGLRSGALGVIAILL